MPQTCQFGLCKEAPNIPNMETFQGERVIFSDEKYLPWTVLMISNVTGERMTWRSHLRCFLQGTVKEAVGCVLCTMALQVVQGCQTVAGYVEMLQWASLLTEGPYLCGNDLQQDNAAVHNGHLTKAFQKNNVARLDYPACSLNLNPFEMV